MNGKQIWDEADNSARNVYLQMALLSSGHHGKKMTKKTITVALVSLLSFSPEVWAQSSGGATSGGASSGSTTGGPSNSPGRSSTTGGAPALGPTTSGPATAPRNNSEIFPPSRLLTPGARTPQGPTTTTPGSMDTTMPGPLTDTTQRPAGPGAAATGPSTSGIGPNTGVRTSPAKRNLVELEECLKLWEPTTHMTKAEWSRSCRRVQARFKELDNVRKREGMAATR